MVFRVFCPVHETGRKGKMYVWQVLKMPFADVARVFKDNGFTDVEADAFYNSKVEDARFGFMGGLI